MNRHNVGLADTSLCECGVIETGEHYFAEYTDVQEELRVRLIQQTGIIQH